MSTPIINRDFAHPEDGWYQIEPKGEHLNDEAGVVQVIDDKAVKSIVANFNADARAGKLRQGHELLVDIEHFKAQLDKESRAYGWATELQARPDGIYARIRWTTTGQAAVDGGDYRFFSTEYDPADCETVSNGDTKRIRLLRLDGLTLTNMNNNRGQRGITNRGASTERARINEAEAREMQNTAAWLFNELARLEQQRTKTPWSVAYTNICNREPVLHQMAKGKYSPEVLCAAFPELRNRLKIYNRPVLQAMSDSASKAAATAAPKVLDYLERKLIEPKDDMGTIIAERGDSERQAWFTFLAQMRKLIDVNGVGVRDAFDMLRKKEPFFWTQGVLSFPGQVEGQ